MGIEWFYSGSLICQMAGCSYTFTYKNLIKYWLKKGAETAAILEGVGISVPLMGRYVGWACGYRMVL